MRTIQIDINGQTETYILDKYATLSDCSVMQRIGGSVLLCSICVDYENPTNEDFLPLSVQYIEKMYSIGKIPQGFIKKEGKPSENEILTSRLIDRSLRPLFPKTFPYSVQVTILVMSYDGKTDVCRDALNLSSICLFLSSVPIINKQILNGVRIICNNGELKRCNSIKDIDDSSLDLFVSGIDNEVSMIEMQALKTSRNDFNHDDKDNQDSTIERANEISKEKLIEAISLARNYIHSNSSCYTTHFESFAKQKSDFKPDFNIHEMLKNTLQIQYGETIKSCLQSMSKTERHTQIQALIQEIAKEQNIELSLITRHIYEIKKDIMRSMILNDKIRADGRIPTQIRDIDIESNLLPYVHGSACFTRGQTQSLVTCTLGNQNDAQTQEGIIPQPKSKVIFHYNFPPFSVGEAFPIGASSRRELGHGNLALKAIESNIVSNPHTIRLVSEILQSNGSSSMASVCGATLAMLGAGIEMHNMVAGIAMGLIYESEDNFVVLSDIMGLEDFDGDMDFKIAGNEHGFSALQLDIKINGLSEKVLNESLSQAQEGLNHILSLMRKVEIVPNYDLLPQKESFCVPNGSIADIIGQGGKTIRNITSKFGVSIDIDKDNNIVSVTANNKDCIVNAKEYILGIIKKKEKRELPYKQDEVYQGVVKKFLDIGVFVELPQGGNGLLKGMNADSGLEVGKQIQVKIISLNNGKIDLDLVDVS